MKGRVSVEVNFRDRLVAAAKARTWAYRKEQLAAPKKRNTLICCHFLIVSCRILNGLRKK
jgi:hypothetical protein